MSMGNLLASVADGREDFKVVSVYCYNGLLAFGVASTIALAQLFSNLGNIAAAASRPFV